jgi:hypothetical protein
MNNEPVSKDNTEKMISNGNTPEKQGLSLQDSSKMKKCPFCAELIQPEAIKCRYCGEFLYGFRRMDVKPQSKKWYYSTTAIVILILLVGPLALPVVWLNPRFKILTKIIITIIVIILTIFLIEEIFYIYQQILKQFEQVNSIEI